MEVEDFGPSGWVSSKYIQQLKSAPKKAESSTAYQQPKAFNDGGRSAKIILERIDKQGWGKPVGGTGSDWNEWLYKETVCPIGWSSSGLFAFLVHGFGEAAYSKLLLIDSHTDAVVVRQVFGDMELDELWDTHRPQIEQLLSEHNIVQHTQFDLVQQLELLPEFELKKHPETTPTCSSAVLVRS